MKVHCCHLCKGQLFRRPLVKLRGMPRAAQYFPCKDEFQADKGRDLSVYQCSSCGLVQLDAPPVKYFKEVITATAFSQKTKDVRRKSMKEFVRRFQLEGKKVLEVGTGKGEMLDILSEVGLRATGIEASIASATAGRSLGRNIVTGYIGNTRRLPGSPFSAFVSFNYLEHLPNPGHILRRIYENTTADAVGFVTVPNLEYLLSSKCFYEFVFDHLSYFTSKTLSYAFESSGFEVLECHTINQGNDIAAIVKKRQAVSFQEHFSDVKRLTQDLRRIVNSYRAQNKKIAIWGAGHRTLALLALSKIKGISYIVDSAKFKQGRFTPVLHIPIVAPECLTQQTVNLVIVMVPGLYPEEVVRSLKQMNIAADVALLRDNTITFMRKKRS